MSNEFSDRMHRGLALKLGGQFEEALEDYLWCWDNGAAFESYSAVRVSFLLGYFADLAKVYPPALHALEERLRQAEEHWQKVQGIPGPYWPARLNAEEDVKHLKRTLAEIHDGY